MASVAPRRLQAEQPLEADPVHPAGRARVPGPAAAPGMGRVRVDVAGDDVRLDLVALDVGGGARVVDRVEQVEELHRLVAAIELGQRHHQPRRGVRVLAAVLADPGRVALDVTGLLRRVVEGRGEQQRRAQPAQHQQPAHRIHRVLGQPARHRPRDHRPRLGDRVDPALVVVGRAERRAIVVVAAAEPLAVPRRLEARRQPGRVGAVARRPGRDRGGCRRSPRTRSARRAGRSRARCSRPGPARRRGSCRRSSRRCRTAAGRGRRWCWPCRWPARSARTASPPRDRPGAARRIRGRRGSAPCRSGRAPVPRARRDRRCARCTAPRRRAATAGRRSSASAARGPTARATSAGRRPRRTAGRRCAAGGRG